MADEHQCPLGEHSEHEHRIKRNESDINRMGNGLREYIDKLVKEIWDDGVIPLRNQQQKMINWTVCGMGAVILHFGLFLLKLLTEKFG